MQQFVLAISFSFIIDVGSFARVRQLNDFAANEFSLIRNTGRNEMVDNSL